MPQAQVFTDSTAGRANVVMRPMPGLWTDDGPHSPRAHTTEPSQPEPELRACAIVLDLLELALLDRCDVDALVKSSIRARRAARRMAIESSEWSVEDLFAPAVLSPGLSLVPPERA